VAESRHANLPILPLSSITTRYQITLAVADQPGVLAVIANLFRDLGVSVETLVQSAGGEPQSGDPEHGAATATLVIGTHEAPESSLAATVAALAETSVIESVVSVLRVEGLS
jgi:homoserine dehydrogenase